MAAWRNKKGENPVLLPLGAQIQCLWETLYKYLYKYGYFERYSLEVNSFMVKQNFQMKTKKGKNEFPYLC